MNTYQYITGGQPAKYVNPAENVWTKKEVRKCIVAATKQLQESIKRSRSYHKVWFY